VVVLYDISTLSTPVKVGQFGQSGAHSQSRLLDGVLYTVSTHWVDGQIEPQDPATFVPLLSSDGTAEPMAPDAIAVARDVQSTAYAVVTAVDLEARTRIGSRSVLGGAETIYMSASNLYLASSAPWSREIAGEVGDFVPFAEGGRLDGSTRLVRVALDGGSLDVAAQGVLPGRLLNQFALDEFQGHLRAATTVSGESYGAWFTASAVYVLDAGLEVVGEIPELAAEESVESVRFMGPVGYVVTFEQTDPLFSIDLTDPAAPKVMGALKALGYSTYLHPYAEGRLLGIGVDGDEWGMVGGLKLTMFDTSNPFDLRELDTTVLPDAPDSAALRQHKAVFVDADRGLVAIPLSGTRQDGRDWKDTASLQVFEYTEGEGFTTRLDVELGADKSWVYSESGVRTLRVGADLYAVTPEDVRVYSLDSFEEVAAVHINDVTPGLN
jgi:uncharacterized secreted protein with C-terminal beta-propeller domain